MADTNAHAPRYRIGEPRVVEHDEAKAHLGRVLAVVTAWLGLRQYVLVHQISG